MTFELICEDLVSFFTTERVNADVRFYESVEKLLGSNVDRLPAILTCGFVQSRLSR
jgi:hypothetical protein